MKIKNLALSAALILSPYAYAELPSFSYIEAGDAKLSGEDDIDGEGYAIEVSHEINDHWYVIGAYNSLSLDDEYIVSEEIYDDFYYNFNNLLKVELSELRLGLGYRWQASDSAYWAADLSYLKVTADIDYEFYYEEGGVGYAPYFVDQDSGSESESFNGAVAKVGYYSNLSEQVSAVLGLTYKNIKIENERVDDSGVFADVTYKLTEKLAVTIGAEITDDKLYFAGFRYYF